jgi:pyrroloquinoline quinone (PQQ) biosynthesis protein C
MQENIEYIRVIFSSTNFHSFVAFPFRFLGYIAVRYEYKRSDGDKGSKEVMQNLTPWENRTRSQEVTRESCDMMWQYFNRQFMRKMEQNNYVF